MSCGNHYLCEYAKQFNEQVVYNPTTIDTENLHTLATKKTSKENARPVIGWTGTQGTLKYLAPLVPILKELENEFDFDFHVICNQNPNYDLKRFRFIPWSKEDEIEQLAKFSIGLMPLVDDAWAKGKCGFKALQYMALETPPVVSPVGVNSSIVQHNTNGFIATTNEEWNTILRYCLEHPDELSSIKKNARTTILEHFSVESNKNNVLNLLYS